MNIDIVCVGKLKETYWTQAVAEYARRLGRYASMKIIEVKEEATPEEEGCRILRHIRSGSYVIALDVRGWAASSEMLAEKLKELPIYGQSDVTFLIGGSDGLSREILEGADLRMSFSNMTFPHQMMRVILLEQIYRSFKIIRKEPYHK